MFIYFLDSLLILVYANSKKGARTLAIKYYRLFDLLQRRGLKKTDLLTLAGISAPTLAKLSKGATVTTEVIEKICDALGVHPGDIMEYAPNRMEGDAE